MKASSRTYIHLWWTSLDDLNFVCLAHVVLIYRISLHASFFYFLFSSRLCHIVSPFISEFRLVCFALNGRTLILFLLDSTSFCFTSLSPKWIFVVLTGSFLSAYLWFLMCVIVSVTLVKKFLSFNNLYNSQSFCYLASWNS